MASKDFTTEVLSCRSVLAKATDGRLDRICCPTDELAFAVCDGTAGTQGADEFEPDTAGHPTPPVPSYPSVRCGLPSLLSPVPEGADGNARGRQLSDALLAVKVENRFVRQPHRAPPVSVMPHDASLTVTPQYLAT